MRKFILESEGRGQWFICDGTELDYQILYVCYSRSDAIKKKNDCSMYKDFDEA